MGRKPNQLILEFFTRGPKLEDASNRYQHTCKACGEKFPKGRIDSLTNHLVKKCTALPVAMRQNVLLRLHELPELPAGSAEKGKHSGTLEKGKSVDLPYAARQTFNGLNGLNVLAEASRQVGASETKGKPKQQQQRQQQQRQQQQPVADANPMILDPALESEGLAALLQNASRRSTSPPQTSAPSLPPIQHIVPTGDNRESTSPHGVPLPPNSGTSTQSSHLSMIAASANEMVPHTGLPVDPNMGGPNIDGNSRFFDGQNGAVHREQWPTQDGFPVDSVFMDNLEEHEASIAAAQRAAAFPRPIAMNPNTAQPRGFVNNFNNTTPSPKPKVRGRFSASRRREVQEVRKRGACIRCRMLKKPCSGDTPCSTCVNVESARLWRQPCIRTRIAEEFPLWQAGLHGTLAFLDINSVKNRITFEHQPGCLEATHSDDADDTCTLISFTALEAHGQHPSQLDPQLQALNHDGGFQGMMAGPRILDGDADDLVGKLEMYMKEMAPTFIERELSGFWQPTLSLAFKLSGQHMEGLLGRTLELWVATQILVDADMVWKMFSNPSQPSSLGPTISSTSLQTLSGTDGRIPVDQFNDPESYSLIQSQLRSAAEKRAAAVSKIVMNDLERRLLQRQQSGSFETFLVALILLNCVERICWLFKTWDVAGTDVRPWPLDTKPGEFCEKGERFSEILYMLLKMRGVPPKTTVRPETGVLLPVETKDEIVIDWFNSIQIPLQLIQQRPNAEFDPSNPRSYDLRYGSKLLQPITVWQPPLSEPKSWSS